MKDPIDVSIIIVSYNTKDLLRDCIASIKKYTGGVVYEIIIVDNNSADGSAEWIKSKIKTDKNICAIFNKENVGFGAANNQGMKKSLGRYILILNSDTIFLENTLRILIQKLNDNEKIGITSCKLLNKDSSIQPTGGYFPDILRLALWATFLDDIPLLGDVVGSYHPRPDGLYENETQLDWVTGAFMLIRRKVYEDVGGFDRDFFMYVEDVDYCARAKKRGWQVWYFPETKIIHLGGASTKGEGVRFRTGSVGREASLVGEFKGLVTFYKKHYPTWQLPLLIFTLKVASVLRMFIFGIIENQKQAREIYAKVFNSI